MQHRYGYDRRCVRCGQYQKDISLHRLTCFFAIGTTIYDCGIKYRVVARENDELTCVWFENGLNQRDFLEMDFEDAELYPSET